MVSDRPPKPKLVKIRVAPRRPSVLIGRKGRVTKRSTLVTHAISSVQVHVPELPKAPSGELHRYQRGEITEAEYLQGRIEDATTHLKGRVSPERLAMLKEVIAQRLETDPLLLEARARLLNTANRPGKRNPV